MISFFRINDPFRLFAVMAILVFLTGIYIWVLEVPMLQPEMTWLLIGERMAEGKAMYIDIVDDTGPLSAAVYWLCHLAFGRSWLALKILALVLAMFQITYLNGIFIYYKSFKENTYIPALLLVILFHLSFDLLTLSPALMGSTFLVLALRHLFSQTVLQKEGSDSILLIGLFGGIAACFHFPLVTFLPFMLISGVIVSGFSFRQLVLSMIAYSLPFTIIALFYFWNDSLWIFFEEFVIDPRRVDRYAHVGLRDLLVLFLPGMVFSVMGFVVGAVLQSQTVNQQKQFQLMFLFVLFGMGSLFLSNRITPYQLVMILPGMAYFGTQLFAAYEKGPFMKALSWIFILGIPFGGFLWIVLKSNSGEINTYAIEFMEKHASTRGKRILVLGEDLGYYQDASLGSRYLNYSLTKNILNDTTDLRNSAEVFRVFSTERPQIIIDEDGLFENLSNRLSPLKEIYQKQGEGRFELK
ncbi:hypothetical protein C943_00786 [Mariniradius saccharolyticus AK6]|uniref:Glycosyltransferase RgtA/B/C/D-like domain-containing protein n=2 Tax=Mariniradius TaxID=1245590 RepID=M7X5Q6_9BACT|nr:MULTISPECIES: hypothetical protein [Mariniradius]EMS32780.1 hypothetical protein C943_00786 [Mariniradius saccharolyticus AK6]MCF1750373.1 hypothetical protein [Mariniradius sediminis]